MTAVTESFREVVALAIAAFMGCNDDDAVRRVLIGSHVSHELADELVAFLPIPFGRKILDELGVNTWPTFDVMNDEGRPSGERHFHDFPVYLAAEEFGSRVDRDVFQRLATWSAEVNAVSDLMKQGRASSARLTKLLVSVPHVVKGISTRAPAPLADVFGAHEALARVLEAHGLRSRRVAGGVTVESGDRWEAKVFAHRCSLEHVTIQVDFALTSSRLGGRTLVESVGGEGATLYEAIRQAFEKFVLGTFHVVLAALYGVASDQVEWETWAGPHAAFRVAVGALVEMGSPPPVDTFASLLDRTKERVLARELPREVHWLRLFHARSDRPWASEALLDNEVWPELLADVEAWPFPASDSLYRLRCFVMLVPA